MNKQGVLVILLVVFIVMLFPATYLVLQDFKPKETFKESFRPEILIKENLKFEINVEDVDTMKLASKIIEKDQENMDKLVSIDMPIDKFGSHIGRVEYIVNEMLYSQTFNYDVYDDQAPVIQQSRDFSVMQGETVDYQSVLSIYDNSLREGETLPILIDDEYLNVNVPGYYYVTVSAKDDAGNLAEYEAIVDVYSVYE